MIKYIAQPPNDELISELILNLRTQDMIECSVTTNGMPIRDAINHSVSISQLCMVVSQREFIDDGYKDTVLLIMGVAPSEEPLIGTVWMVGTNSLEKVSKRKFIEYSHKFLNMFHSYYPCLTNMVLSTNTKTIRWLEYLGARILPTIFQIGHYSFLRFTRSDPRISNTIVSNEEFLQPQANELIPQSGPQIVLHQPKNIELHNVDLSIGFSAEPIGYNYSYPRG